MLNNKVCIVTGGAQGIGRTIVERFAAEGAEHVYACDMNLDAMTEAYAEVANITPVQLNVCDRPAIQALIEEIKQRHGRVDVLVNNAGITKDNLLDRMSEQDWDLVLGEKWRI